MIFAQIVDGFRDLRASLMSGLGVLLMLWLWVGESLDKAAEDGRLAEIVTLFDSLGGTAKLVALAGVAAAVGAPVDKLITRRIVKVVERWSRSPDWDLYTQAAVDRRDRHEEYQGRADHRGSVSWEVPGFHRGVDLHAEVEARRRRRDESRFRLASTVVLLPSALTLGVHDGGWWWLSVPLVLMPLIDGFLTAGSADREMADREVEALTDDIKRLEGSDQLGDDDRAALVDLQSRRDYFCNHRFRRRGKPPARATCPNCGKASCRSSGSRSATRTRS